MQPNVVDVVRMKIIKVVFIRNCAHARLHVYGAVRRNRAASDGDALGRHPTTNTGERDDADDECGDILAVSDLRGKNKEKFSYSELADLITKVSKSFKNYGLVKGDVVTVISENSPRWLIADQGLMRLGAINAVRGINSPSVELDYIIEHSNSVGLIVQSKETWLKLNQKEELKKRLKFIINLEDEEFESLISWSQFIKGVEKENSQNNVFEKDNLQINDIWSEENKYKIWLDVEIAAAQAMEKLGYIPRGVSVAVKKKGKINVKRIHAIESKVKHDVIAFLTSITQTARMLAWKQPFI